LISYTISLFCTVFSINLIGNLDPSPGKIIAVTSPTQPTKTTPDKKTPEKKQEETYAFPSTIPSVLSKELLYNSVGEDDQVQTFKLSLLMPVSTLCSYCLKLDAVLFPIPDPPTENYKLGDEKLFCVTCIENVFTNINKEYDVQK
jgi:hypothetical protein